MAIEPPSRTGSPRGPAGGPPSLSAGRVGRAHGLDGSFYVTGARGSLLSAGIQVAVAGQPRRVVRRAGTDQHPILRVEGCESREAAQALRGKEIVVDSAAVPQLAEQEFWAEELEGCQVDAAGRPMGTVRRLVELPSCEVLEVHTPGGRELLVPLVRDAIVSVDIAARRIEIDLQFLGDLAEGQG
ncbi:MAG TPA: ribosome maturation factor RimM [Solirubrobacteraceae bacterium]|nr:ribosome maturation factor RimM [Solirubrobacteraceae bacterium]